MVAAGRFGDLSRRWPQAPPEAASTAPAERNGGGRPARPVGWSSFNSHERSEASEGET
jgi:hypothetical protein